MYSIPHLSDSKQALIDEAPRYETLALNDVKRPSFERESRRHGLQRVKSALRM